MNELLGSTPTPAACIICGNELTGRVDRKYCSVECKAQYNNQKKAKEEEVVLRINRILRKNWSILRALFVASHTTTNKETMKQMGFDFRYQTQRVVDLSKGTDYYSCYEWYYTINYNGVVQIVKNENT